MIRVILGTVLTIGLIVGTAIGDEPDAAQVQSKSNAEQAAANCTSLRDSVLATSFTAYDAGMSASCSRSACVTFGATQVQLQPGDAHVNAGSADYDSALVWWNLADTDYGSGQFCVSAGDAFWLTDGFDQAVVMYDASLGYFADASADFYQADCDFFDAKGHWNDAHVEFSNLLMQL